MLEGPMRTQSLTSQMAESQEAHAKRSAAINTNAVLFTLYTVVGDGQNAKRVARYFPGATLYRAAGLWNSEIEESEVIEIVAESLDSLQAIVNLAGDIKHALNQTAVLVTYERIGSVLVS
jgi:hypothetical protein